jgi:hypothetical protein
MNGVRVGVAGPIQTRTSFRPTQPSFAVVLHRISALRKIEDESATSVWARILGMGAERLGIADFLDLRGLSRDAITYLSAVYPTRTLSERSTFEKARG